MPKQNLAIALCRVSSFEQLESNSLGHQKDNVLKAADELGVTIPEDGLWSGHVSSKKGVNYARKDLKEMLEYCRKHSNVKYLIVQEVDRFMRSPDEQVYFQVKFMNEVGVKIWYADKPELNKDDIYAGLMRYMEGFRAAGSNDERQRKSINGQTKALEEGRFPFSPKPGYKKGRETGVQEVHPVNGNILKTILIKIATHQVTPTQALNELNKSDFVLNHSVYKMDKFRNIVIDPFYAGIVEINKQVNVRNENGLHEPLITKEQHKELLRIMSNKPKNQAGPRKNGNPDFPLNNILFCDDCKENTKLNKFVGFKHTNGVTPKVYMRYRCRADGCGKYLKADYVHEQVKNLFNTNPMTLDAKQDLMGALQTVWTQQEGQAEQDLIRLQHKVQSIKTSISNQIDALSDKANAGLIDEIRQSIVKKKAETEELEATIERQQSSSNLDKQRFLDFAIPYVDNMSDNFFELTRDKQLVCKQLVFPGGFWVNKNEKIYTPEISELYRLTTKKMDTEVSDNSRLVRVQGL